ncbi:MAG TPA: hypothetical protein VK614_01165 [Allosphingosinicella sp.]|nr:hypothetical protein [Allosphingosinicella sp.]
MPRDLDVILIFAVLTTGAVLIIIQIGRLWRASMLHKTIREAISRDNPAVTELVAGVEEEQKPAGANDDRTALVLIALGLALLLFSALQNSDDALRQMGGASAFPIFVGLALLVRQYLVRKRGGQG